MQGWKEGNKGKKIKFLKAHWKQLQVSWGMEEMLPSSPQKGREALKAKEHGGEGEWAEQNEEAAMW